MTYRNGSRIYGSLRTLAGAARHTNAAYSDAGVPMRAFVLAYLIQLVSVQALASDTESSRIHFWDLPTGSHIAYVHYLAPDPSRQPPVIFLHGGPGAYLVDHPAIAEEFYESIARLGFDVYIYDQIGSGHSARLQDPRLYTVDRHIRDLEAIRQKIRAARLILIGDSWGATLGANYIAEHPNRCAKAVFSGPGSIDRSDPRPVTYEDAPMTRAAETWFAKIFAQPRYQRMRDPLTQDIAAVYRSVADSEMDVQFDSFVQSSLPFLVCDPAKIPADESVHGMGWWVNLMTGADMQNRGTKTRETLSRTKIPVLVLRGGCDYLRWEVAYDYRRVFPNSIFLYVPDAGHAFGYDRPKIYSAAIRAFLLGQPLPLEPYTRDTAPPRMVPKAVFRDAR